MPSAKVATTAAFGAHARYKLHHFAITRPHFCAKQYKVLRWRTHRKRQSALTRMCNDITGNHKHTLVAFGNAKFNSSGPTVSLRRRLRSLCHVYDMDEFRTSMLCSSCHQRMTGMASPVQGEASLDSAAASVPVLSLRLWTDLSTHNCIAKLMYTALCAAITGLCQHRHIWPDSVHHLARINVYDCVHT